MTQDDRLYHAATPGAVFDVDSYTENPRAFRPVERGAVVSFISSSPHFECDQDEPRYPVITKRALGMIGDHHEVYSIKLGGMGRVYLCRDLRTVDSEDASRTLRVALKTPSPRLIRSAVARRAFRREATIWSKLSTLYGVHPVWGILDVDDTPFIATPVVDDDRRGRANLRDFIQVSGMLSVTHTWLIAWKICSTLLNAQGVVPGLAHGDLKPENVLMSLGQPYITDFGIARSLEHAVGAERLAPTPRYAAPELFEGSPPDQRSDIYAVGVMVREMLRSGDKRDPTSDGALRRAMYELSDQCCESDRSNRPASFALVVDELQRLDVELGELPRDARAGLQVSTALATVRGVMNYAMSLEHTNTLGHSKYAISRYRELGASGMNIDSLLAVANALMKEGKDAEALSIFRKCLANLEDDPKRRYRALVSAAIALKHLKEFDQSIRLHESLLRLEDLHEGRDALVLSVNLAGVLIEAGHLDRARAFLGKLLNKFPDSAEVWMQLGSLYDYEGGSVLEHVSCLRRAALLRPDYPQARACLANALLFRAGNPDAAAEQYGEALMLGADSREIVIESLCCCLLSSESLAGELMAKLGGLIDMYGLESLMPDVEALVEEWKGA